MITLVREVPPQRQTIRRPIFSASCKCWVVGAILAVVVCVGFRFKSVFIGNNLHIVIPGRVYRSAQPSSALINKLHDEIGVKTVVSLRGNTLYWHEWQAQDDPDSLGVNFEPVWFDSERLPFASEVRRLVQILDTAEYPILIHCRRGADRTGLASAIALLLYSDADVDQARGQLSLSFGHYPVGPAIRLHTFLDDYEGWLNAQGVQHSPSRFRHWIWREYRADYSSSPLQIVGTRPDAVPVGRAVVLRLRTRNTGKQTWHLRPHRTAGIHLWHALVNLGKCEIREAIAGQMHKNVHPGETCEFTVVIDPIHEPGRYRFHADLRDPHTGHFFCIGSKVLEFEFEVHDRNTSER